MVRSKYRQSDRLRPSSDAAYTAMRRLVGSSTSGAMKSRQFSRGSSSTSGPVIWRQCQTASEAVIAAAASSTRRSEERRVGKEGRAGGGRYRQRDMETGVEEYE